MYYLHSVIHRQGGSLPELGMLLEQGVFKRCEDFLGMLSQVDARMKTNLGMTRSSSGVSLKIIPDPSLIPLGLHIKDLIIGLPEEIEIYLTSLEGVFLELDQNPQ